MRLRVIPKDGDVERLKEGLDAFAKMSDEAYKHTVEVWEKRLKRVPTIKGGTPNFPTLHFDWLPDDDGKKSLIFFVSAPTPTAWKIFKMGKRKMEKQLKGYLNDVQGIETDIRFLGD